jgi:hypothetical protein
MAYRKTWDEKVYRPFKEVIDRAMLLNVGDKFEFEAKPYSAKMAEQRIREYLRFMNDKDPDVDYVRMFIVRPLAGLGRVEIERRFPIDGVNIEIFDTEGQ